MIRNQGTDVLKCGLKDPLGITDHHLQEILVTHLYPCPLDAASCISPDGGQHIDKRVLSGRRLALPVSLNGTALYKNGFFMSKGIQRLNTQPVELADLLLVY